MKSYISIIIIFLVIILPLPVFSQANSLGESLAGQILLNVEGHGEAWYVYPDDNKRYYLGRPHDAFEIMRELGLGITEFDFQRLAQAGMPVEGDLDLAKRLAGKIVLQVEKNGEAWYIYPKDLKKYYLGRPDDAWRIMRELCLGITRENLAKIHKPGLEETINLYSKYEHKNITIASDSFSVDVITIDLTNPNLKIITDAAEPHPSPSLSKESGTHGAASLAKFVLENNGFAGINGTYFDTSASKKNYYFYPVYDTDRGDLINASELKYWTTGPIMAWDENNKFYYFKDSREFVSVDYFEETYKVKLQAAIGNRPRLIENKMNLLIEWDIDEKQRNVKSYRNAIAYTENKSQTGFGIIYLVVARNATVPDLADIMQAMKVDYALNLDGGYSSALWYNDEYMVMPGRDIPNAIIFMEE